MATSLGKRKLPAAGFDPNAEVKKAVDSGDFPDSVLVSLQNSEGEELGTQFEMPIDTTPEQLQYLLGELMEEEVDDIPPHSFSIHDTEIQSTLAETLMDIVKAKGRKSVSTEEVLPIIYRPEAVFRVSAVTRCTTTLAGHTDAVLHAAFSPDGKSLATGGGDCTVRFWDLNTETPLYTTSKEHRNWILSLSWSPDAKLLASGDKNGEIRLWDTSMPAGSSQARKCVGKPLKGHSKWITSLSWEPIHLCGEREREKEREREREKGKSPLCRRLASASKDGTVRVWDVVRRLAVLTLAGHTMGVTQVKWGGTGMIYTASQDRTIKVWNSTDGRLIRSLEGHGHWVNTLALNTDYVLRCGGFEHTGKPLGGEGERERDGERERETGMVEGARERYKKVLKEMGGDELLATGSDDLTMFLWNPSASKRPLTRLTGHQQLVNAVAFSPDGRYLISASFDKSLRLWDGRTGKFLAVFRGHVGSVYAAAWSADSRLVMSASKDSTLKVWDVKRRKIATDLPGHADEVYCVDWSPNGEKAASGGKDRMVKLWRN